MKEGKEAKRYHKVKNLFFYFGLALDFFLLVVLQLSGLSVYLRSFSSEVLPSSYGTNFIYILIFCVGMHAIHFPLKYFLEFIWEHKFKLSNQTFLSWLKDDAKKFALSFILMVVLLEIVYMLMRFLKNFPNLSPTYLKIRPTSTKLSSASIVTMTLAWPRQIPWLQSVPEPVRQR